MNGAHREDQAVCSHQHSVQQCESLQDSRLLAQVRFYSAGLQTSSCVNMVERSGNNNNLSSEQISSYVECVAKDFNLGSIWRSAFYIYRYEVPKYNAYSRSLGTPCHYHAAKVNNDLLQICPLFRGAASKQMFKTTKTIFGFAWFPSSQFTEIQLYRFFV